MLTGAERSKTLWALNDKLSAFSLEIAVILLLPFVNAVELGGDAVLQHRCLRLAVYLFLYLVIDLRWGN